MKNKTLNSDGGPMSLICLGLWPLQKGILSIFRSHQVWMDSHQLIKTFVGIFRGEDMISPAVLIAVQGFSLTAERYLFLFFCGICSLWRHASTLASTDLDPSSLDYILLPVSVHCSIRRFDPDLLDRMACSGLSSLMGIFSRAQYIAVGVELSIIEEYWPFASSGHGHLPLHWSILMISVLPRMYRYALN